jgi:hypothetical protein
MGAFQKTLTCTIDVSADNDLSDGVYIGPLFSLVGIRPPAAWDAAGVAFQVSWDGVTYDILRDDAGTEITKTVVAGQPRELDSSEFKTAIWIKVRSGTSGSPVTQTADRVFTLYARKYLAA